ncbi:MAG: M28 family peptidase [Anaerolineae bacterium]
MRRHITGFRQVSFAILAIALLSVACTHKSKGEQFDGQKAYLHILAQCNFGPRPVGSEENWRTADYIAAELEKLGWATEVQDFTYRGVNGRNVIGAQGSGPLIILGAHYDTRPIADRDLFDRNRPVLGANDGASGVAVLLELARVLDLSKADIQVWLVFFDAEDHGNINGWPFSVGAAYMAQRLSVQPEAVIIVDMVGDSEQEIFWEQNSDEKLMRTLWAIAAELGYEKYFIPQYRYAIIDDHVPFRQLGLVAVDIIDFDYPYWHTTEDTLDKVSPESLQRVGRVLETWLEKHQ